MKISILNPNFSGDVSIVDIGATYLATYLNERTHHRAQIVDFTYHRKKWKRHFENNIKKFKPDIIGITCVSMYMQYVDLIMKEIKNRHNLPIILGGYHTTLMPEESIALPEVDAVCMGDGEYAVSEYLDAVEKTKSIDGIKGIWGRENGRIIKNPRRELIQDVDSLPMPNYELWEDIDKFIFYNGVIYFIGNRGCPFPCTYCSEDPIRHLTVGTYIRKRDPRGYAREMKMQWEKYKDRGMRVAHTFDPIFPLDKEWVRNFCDEYKKIGLASQLPFSCFTRADTVDEEKIDMLADANLKIARIGIEAGNERIRMEVYEKKIPTSQYKKVISHLHKCGVAITGYNILGGPGETMETMQDTFNLVKELKVERPIFFTYRPLPKTKGAEKVIEMGGRIDNQQWKKIDSLHERSNVYTGKLTPRQICRFRKKCLLYFTTKRTLQLIRRQGFRFFINFIKYVIKGIKDGVGFQYIIGYFFVSGGDNVIS